MGKPWEKYSTAPSKPWERYGAQPNPGERMSLDPGVIPEHLNIQAGEDVPWYKRAWNAVSAPVMDSLVGGDGFTRRGLIDAALGPGMSYAMESAAKGNPKDSPLKNAIKTGIAGTITDTGDVVASATSPLSLATMGAGAATRVPGAVGTLAKVATTGAGVGFAGKGAYDVADAGLENTPEAWQKRFMGGAMVAGGAAGVKALGSEVPSPRAAVSKLTAGKQAAVVPSAMNLPVRAVDGVEAIYRAAAPTGKNAGFRENLYAAAGDLADIGRKIDLGEAKGGILNPDMRVRAAADAIREHMAEMYAQERAPQIERNAGAPVRMSLGPDVSEGLQYVKRAGGSDEIRGLAAKALEEQTLTLAEADKLAMAANEYLRGFERMTPAEKAATQMSNRRLGSLKALDRGLGSQMDSVLRSAGEDGIRGYERRYAALGEIESQLRSRMNAVELDVNPLKPVRQVLGLVRGGKEGIASASQAAVADVNIGLKLQKGFKKLASTNLTRAARAARYPNP